MLKSVVLTSNDQRADPNLIHWQKTDEPALQNETRTLLMASHPGIRPPSYA